MKAPAVLHHPALHWVVGAAIGAVFLYASLEKIAQPREFARIVYHYQILGPGPRTGYLPANLFALALPWVEATAGVLLIVGIWRREAAAVAALLVTTFLVAVVFALARGVDIQNCGCFSVTGTGRAAGWRLLAGDVVLLVGSLVLALAPPPPAD